MEKRARTVGTHDGTFHADEVTACALLILFDLVDIDKIVRTRESSELATCEYVCDVGGVYDPKRKLFDHHQVEYQGDMSSAGMVLEYLKNIGKIPSALFDYFNKLLIMGVDAHDNGRGPQDVGYCSFSNVVSNFTPVEYDFDIAEMQRCFLEALKFVLGHLKRLKQRHEYISSCKQVVAEAMEHRDAYLFFDQPLPWQDLFFELGGVDHPAVFVIMPSGYHWKLRGIPPSDEDRMKVRVPLPEDWAGLSTNELKRVTGISGAIFCHKGRFISVWETKEDALKALKICMKELRKNEDRF